jgi:hypothetical protein
MERNMTTQRTFSSEWNNPVLYMIRGTHDDFVSLIVDDSCYEVHDPIEALAIAAELIKLANEKLEKLLDK